MIDTNARKILIGLITNKDFIKKYLQLFPKGLFLGEIGAGVVEKWCIKYYEKYGEAVNSNIKHAYDKSVANKSLGGEELEFVEILLSSLSSESDTSTATTEYLVDEAVEYANKRNLENLKSNIDYALDSGKVEDALKAYEKFKKVEKGESVPVVSLFNTAKVSELALKKSAEPFLHSLTDNPFL